MLDEAYFISGEIADFCLRARRHGARLLIDPQVTVYHDQGRSSELRIAFLCLLFPAQSLPLCAQILPSPVLAPGAPLGQCLEQYLWLIMAARESATRSCAATRPAPRVGGKFGDRSIELWH